MRYTGQRTKVKQRAKANKNSVMLLQKRGYDFSSPVEAKLHYERHA